LACQAKIIEIEAFDTKVWHYLPDTVLIEYKYFLEHLSHYLPIPELRDNARFVEWLRTPGLSDQFATEIDYVLPKPRQQHY
jgi:hypothetical protein